MCLVSLLNKIAFYFLTQFEKNSKIHIEKNQKIVFKQSFKKVTSRNTMGRSSKNQKFAGNKVQDITDVKNSKLLFIETTH